MLASISMSAIVTTIHVSYRKYFSTLEYIPDANSNITPKMSSSDCSLEAWSEFLPSALATQLFLTSTTTTSLSHNLGQKLSSNIPSNTHQIPSTQTNEKSKEKSTG